jgi:hypothetical protein
VELFACLGHWQRLSTGTFRNACSICWPHPRKKIIPIRSLLLIELITHKHITSPCWFVTGRARDLSAHVCVCSIDESFSNTEQEKIKSHTKTYDFSMNGLKNKKHSRHVECIFVVCCFIVDNQWWLGRVHVLYDDYQWDDNNGRHTDRKSCGLFYTEFIWSFSFLNLD